MNEEMLRYPIRITDEQVVLMPRGARVIKVECHASNDVLLGVASYPLVEMCAVADPQASLVRRCFRLMWPEAPVLDSSNGLSYVDSFVLVAGSPEFHMFEVEGQETQSDRAE